MYAPLGFGQANALMPGRFGQPMQAAPQMAPGMNPGFTRLPPGMGLPQAEMQMDAQRGMAAPVGGGNWQAPMMSMPTRAAPFPGMPGGPSAPGGGWMNSPFFRGMPGAGAGILGPNLGSAAGGAFGGAAFPARPTVGIPEGPNMPGMPQRGGMMPGPGRFGGGGYR